MKYDKGIIDVGKTLFFLVLAVSLFFPDGNVRASGSTTGVVGENCTNVVLAAMVDQEIAFYEGRTYLADASSRILAEVGQDAVRKAGWLLEHRNALIKEMVARNMPVKEQRVRIFLNKRFSHHQKRLAVR